MFSRRHQPVLTIFRSSLGNRSRRLATLVATLLCVLCIDPLLDLFFDSSPAPVLQKSGIPQTAKVLSVIDGDTIEVQIGTERQKLRLLGIDAPEVHESEKAFRDSQRLGVCETWMLRQGRISQDALRKLVLRGAVLTLERGPKAKDRFGRLLVYAFLADGRLLNLLLVEQGLASVYFQEKQGRFRNDIMQAYQSSRKSQRGMWKNLAQASKECSSLSSRAKHPIS